MCNSSSSPSSAQPILQLHGMGPKALHQLRCAFAAKGKSFAGNSKNSREKTAMARVKKIVNAPEKVDAFKYQLDHPFKTDGLFVRHEGHQDPKSDSGKSIERFD
jgi:hypothetical protein